MTLLSSKVDSVRPVLKNAPHADAAKEFLSFLHSNEAQQIFRKHHFDL